MKLEIMAIYDKAIDAYMRPYFSQTIGQAVRQFADEVNRAEQSPMGAHPEDYSLFHIGTFHDQNAKLNECEPHCVARAHEIHQSPENRQDGYSHTSEEQTYINERIKKQAIAT